MSNRDNYKLLNEKFGKHEKSGGADWSVLAWKVKGKSKRGFDLYITEDDVDRFSLIDRDWSNDGSEEDEVITEIFSSPDLKEVIKYYEENYSNKKDKEMEAGSLDYKIDFLEKWIKKSDEADALLDDTIKFERNHELNIEYEDFINDENNKLSDEEYNMSAEDLLFYLMQEKNKPVVVEVEKTAFNDANMFLEEYKDYLIGKTVKVGEIDDMVELPVITDVIALDEDSIEIRYEDGYSKSNPTGITPSRILSDDFQSLIDGEITNQLMLNGETNNIMLIIQEEIIEEEKEEDKIKIKINKPEYKYYIFDSSRNKILAGFEYKEDALIDLEARQNMGQKQLAILSKRELSNSVFNPEDDNNWLSELNDYAIIDEALSYAVEQGNFSDGDKIAYIEKYKAEGKYVTVIKANLIYYFTKVNTDFKNAVMNSQMEKAVSLREKAERLMKELNNLIKKDI